MTMRKLLLLLSLAPLRRQRMMPTSLAVLSLIICQLTPTLAFFVDPSGARYSRTQHRLSSDWFPLRASISGDDSSFYSSGGRSTSDADKKQLERLRLIISNAFFSDDAILPSNLTALEGDIMSSTKKEIPMIRRQVVVNDDDDDPRRPVINYPNALPGPREDVILENLPLYLSSDNHAMLPGFQAIWTLDSTDDYAHLFRRIVNGTQPWRFGYCSMIDDEDDGDGNLEESHGTLLQIADYRQFQKDGSDGSSIRLLVQALDPFQIVKATPAAPFAGAEVRLVRDNEIEATSPSVSAEDDWKAFETLADALPNNDKDLADPQSLTKYDLSIVPDELQMATSPANQKHVLQGTLTMILHAEYQLWIAIVELVSLLIYLQESSRDTMREEDSSTDVISVVLPPELLGLLPSNLPPGVSNSFGILEANLSDAAKLNPDLRVADRYNDPLRRARRLSFGVWHVMEQLSRNPKISSLLPEGALHDPAIRPTQQQILEVSSILERLELAKCSMQSWHGAIRKNMDW